MEAPYNHFGSIGSALKLKKIDCFAAINQSLIKDRSISDVAKKATVGDFAALLVFTYYIISSAVGSNKCIKITVLGDPCFFAEAG